MHVLSLATDSFGGYGGIALHCRHILGSLSESTDVESIHVIPRIPSVSPISQEEIPEKVHYHPQFLAKTLGYLRGLIHVGVLSKKWDVIFVHHIHLLPAGALLARIHKAKLILICHGIEAWQQPNKPLLRSLKRVDLTICVSHYTKKRFLQWSEVEENKTVVILNAMDLTVYSPGPKSKQLIERYQLSAGPTLITIGRLSAAEQAKGFDKVIAAMPALIGDYPDLQYLIVGEGDDKSRLEKLAVKYGVANKVIFCGKIAEEEKADHYRLGDVYVMPSQQEGFGFVFLEAQACGLPLIGSKIDGSRDALLDGKLGLLVNPEDNDELETAIRQSINKPKQVSDLLSEFAISRFNGEIQSALRNLLG